MKQLRKISREAARMGGKAAALAPLALGLAACASSVDFTQMRVPKFDSSTVFVPDPTQFAPKQEASKPITPADLVDANGMCADMGPAAAAVPPASGEGNPENLSAPAAAPALARNVALQMSECEVVRSLGRAGDIQISANERGERVVVMTYTTPERPVYRFVAGRLATIERTAEPPPPEAAKKKPAPKKRARPAT
jgi:hypothetical protein